MRAAVPVKRARVVLLRAGLGIQLVQLDLPLRQAHPPHLLGDKVLLGHGVHESFESLVTQESVKV